MLRHLKTMGFSVCFGNVCPGFISKTGNLLGSVVADAGVSAQLDTSKPEVRWTHLGTHLYFSQQRICNDSHLEAQQCVDICINLSNMTDNIGGYQSIPICKTEGLMQCC